MQSADARSYLRCDDRIDYDLIRVVLSLRLNFRL